MCKQASYSCASKQEFFIGPGVYIHVIKIRCIVAYMTEERFEVINT